MNHNHSCTFNNSYHTTTAMPVDSLLEMTRRACGRYSRRVDDIGDLPYEMVRPILLKIENPEQLHQLEQKCPQIIGEDAEIWLNMIKRDIPDWDTKPHQPSNPKNWYKVYRKLKQDAKDEMVAGEERLKAALSSINTRKETAQVVNEVRRLPPPPRSPNRSSRFSKMGRHATPMHKMTPLEKIRKEARAAHSPKMNRPTHELTKQSRGVTAAPIAMVEDLRRQKFNLARSATNRFQPLQSPTTTTAQRIMTHEPSQGGYDLMKDREARLRALKTGNRMGGSPNNQSRSPGSERHGPVLNTQFLEDDDLGDDDDEDEDEGDDDLFGDLPKTKQADVAVAPRTSPVTANPQPRVLLKRKAPASIFYEPSKRRNVVVK